MGTVHAADQPASDGAKAAAKTSTVATSQFATLRGMKAVPMASSELDAVKGMHVHFVNNGNNNQYDIAPGVHLAGDLKTHNNWSNEWGGSDGVAVAPSYHGLCKAAGVSPVGNGNGGPGANTSGIFIPNGPNECPL
jgi:hypothetical protein